MTKSINVIDLFAGPGGLGEGFSSYKSNDHFPFNIRMSVEKEASAHKTLTLRAFVRKFRGREIPKAYYEYIQSEELTTDYLKEKHPEEWMAAVEETLGGPKTLGTEDDNLIFSSIHKIRKKEQGPFVVIGGPPCQAYSVMGRIKNSTIDGYSAEEDHRNFLYEEYLKVIDLVNPEIFVMENVRGILTAKVNSERIFPQILSDLGCPAKAVGKTHGPEYFIYSLSTEPASLDISNKPNYKSDQDFVIKSEEFGVPQSRHRVILLGVRADIAKKQKASVLDKTNRVTTDQVLADLPPLRSAVSRQKDNHELWQSTVIDQGKKLIEILSQRSEHLVAKNVELALEVISNTRLPRGNKFFYKTKLQSKELIPTQLKNFFTDNRLHGYSNHFARSHMPSDLQRYLFCAAFARTNKQRNIPSPNKNDFPPELAPNHKSWDSGKFSDRFRVQFKGKASSTITSHINKDGHYFIHYDPTQCRSLTVREAARLQTFPDNYFFEGNQTQQYVQVGNAVPPYLASKIASIVGNLIFNQI